MNEIISIISNLGFPIFMLLLLWNYITKDLTPKLDALKDAIVELKNTIDKMNLEDKNG